MTPTTPPSPTVGDVITTAGELDGLDTYSPGDIITIGGRGWPWIKAATGKWWRQGAADACTWPQVLAWHQSALDDPDDETDEPFRPVLMVPAPPAAPTAGVDREALAADITLLLESARNRCSCCAEVDGDLTDAANRLRMALAAQPTPAPVDADAVERAVMAAARCDVRVEDADCAHMDDSMPCRCQNRFSYCMEHDGEEPQDPSVTVCPWAARIAAAALAAAGLLAPGPTPAEAWDEGFEVGWEHCQDGNFGTDAKDDDTPNPYCTPETQR